MRFDNNIYIYFYQISLSFVIKMKFARNIIIKCDIYGYPISFNMEANNESTSFVGGVMSIITMIIIGFFFCLGLIDLFSGSNYKVAIPYLL